MAKQFYPSVTPEIVRLVGQIDTFKGAWPAIERAIAPDQLNALRQTAFIESVGAGTRLDGLLLSDKDVSRLMATRPAWSFRTSGERKAAGYAEAWEASVRTSVPEPFTEDFIRQRHRDLFKYGKSPHPLGEYKRAPHMLTGFDPEDDTPAEPIRTATPKETPKRMREIVGWINQNFNNPQFHPLLTIPVFVATFLAINPFDDGNGRLSRLLTLVLLRRAGYGYMSYSSLDRAVEQERDKYVREIRGALVSLDRSKTPNYKPWTVFLLRALETQARNLHQLAAPKAGSEAEQEHQERLRELPELSARIVTFINAHGRGDMGGLILDTGVSRNTLKVHLRKLLAKGVIVKHGEGRGVWYTLPR